jgi:hypothetical protein
MLPKSVTVEHGRAANCIMELREPFRQQEPANPAMQPLKLKEGWNVRRPTIQNL